MDSKTNGQNTGTFAIRRLRNFCTSYNLKKSEDLLADIESSLISGNYASLNDINKDDLRDYLEALEEVLPALYELQKHFDVSGQKFKLNTPKELP